MRPCNFIKPLMILAWMTSSMLLAQSITADKIIETHFQKTGGFNAWKSLNSVILKGQLVVSLNEKYPIEIYQQRPNLVRSQIKLKTGNYSLLEGYDGKKGHATLESGAIGYLPDYKPQSFEDNLMNYKTKGFSVKLLESKTVNGFKCFVVQLSKDGQTTNYYFDQKTHWLIREDNAQERIDYSNFRVVKGLIMPYTLKTVNKDNGSEFQIYLSGVAVNAVIPKNTFKF